MSDDWRDALRNLMPSGAEPEAAPCEAADPAPAPKCGQLRVSVERKGRGGKVATIVYGFPDDYPHTLIDELAGSLRRSLGTGGSARGGEILLQGDRADDILSALKKLGYKARKC